MGIACDISGLGDWRDSERFPADEYKTSDECLGRILPFKVLSWLGLRSYSGPFYEPVFDKQKNIYTSLTQVNDSGKWTFKQIADLITKKQHELFIIAEERAEYV